MVVGQEVSEVSSYGKHLVIGFSNALAIHAHMKMTGFWRIYEKESPSEYRNWRMNAEMVFDSGVMVRCYRAPIFELRNRSELRLDLYLGPDLLAPEFDMERLIQRVREVDQRSEFSVVLLDQTVAAGIGNIYRCETLFMRSISPFTPVGELTNEEVKNAYLSARSALLSASHSRASLKIARGQPYVYRRTGESCVVCGSLIRSKYLQSPYATLDRWVYYCPTCQPVRR
ncbi:endonuclease-8 [Ferrithrix thermotolerans DSM 19514]|jgi:endonuclease-8|uniref:DNA-(apurinic or apyrimidinic site) lyase n=2 Tax=Ferrithrix TaxID=643949 RepID=A0A1M4TGY1_9ACTN|nr:endonuclease-8 [Ferrithrix thermotolerans DSM 19514]